MTKRKLRISQVIVRVDLAWDDGNELTPGPSLEPVSLPLSKVNDFLEQIPLEIERLQETLSESHSAPDKI